MRVVDPYDLAQVDRVLKEELAAEAPSIIISRRPCVMFRGTVHKPPIAVDEGNCTGCTMCMQIGCPAISVPSGTVRIDSTLCIGCGVCSQMCTFDVLGGGEKQ